MGHGIKYKMHEYEQGDILIIPFPFTDLTGIKQRPAVVISNDDYNKSEIDIVVCAITSNLEDSNHGVTLEKKDLLSGFIVLKSLIKVDKIISVDKNIIRKKIAKIKKNKLEEVFKILDEIIK